MTDQISTILEQLLDEQGSGSLAEDRQRLDHLMASLTEQQIIALLDALCRRIDAGGRAIHARSAAILRSLSDWQQQRGQPIGDSLRNSIIDSYSRLRGKEAARSVLLKWLAASGRTEDLTAMVEQITVDPPGDGRSIALSLAPLFQSQKWAVSAVFPQLFDALAHPLLAAPVLDLANYVTRRGRVQHHPGIDHFDDLVRLLGALVQRLAQVEDDLAPAGRERQEKSQQVEASVAVVISICDALALIGDRRAVGKLYQALSLRHRRLRAEAAVALARLGEDEGINVLVSMVVEPVTRLRVLADAEAIGFLDRIDPKYTTPEAHAEAEVALALSQPTSFGLPPQQCEHIHSQTLYWPGYEEPINCHLVRYVYDLAEGHYANIALHGPATHALTADLNDLPPDEIFAVYAGWHAEHEEMFEVLPDQWTASQTAIADKLSRQLAQSGFAEVQPIMLGVIFGQWALVAQTVRDDVAGIAVIDEKQIEFQPIRPQRHPLGPPEVYWRYKGRRLLWHFNP